MVWYSIFLMGSSSHGFNSSFYLLCSVFRIQAPTVQWQASLTTRGRSKGAADHERRKLSDIISKLRSMVLDLAEYTYLRAIVLFKPGTFTQVWRNINYSIGYVYLGFRYRMKIRIQNNCDFVTLNYFNFVFRLSLACIVRYSGVKL